MAGSLCLAKSEIAFPAGRKRPSSDAMGQEQRSGVGQGRLKQKVHYLFRQLENAVKEDPLHPVLIQAVALAMIAGLFFHMAAAAVDSTGANSTSAVDASNMHAANGSHSAKRGFFFDESSSVRGAGDISIKGKFNDYAVSSRGWMKGSGSISLESLRIMNKAGREVDFLQKSDLVFAGGLLKNKKSMSLPLFEKGRGATVSERFNLSHVDKSETDMIRSVNNYNNTMIFDAALAFEGLWNIKNTKGWSMSMDKRNEVYTGSFQTQKRIEFNDSNILE